MSYGEKLSARFIAALLDDCGLPAEFVDLSHIIDFNPPQGLDPTVYRELARVVGERVRACGDRVPVITGYFGRVPGGLLKSCGRGYSDLLAAIVAVGVDGKELQVWKEVSGVYTADPRKVSTAKLLPSIHPAEANELTFYGWSAPFMRSQRGLTSASRIRGHPPLHGRTVHPANTDPH